MRHEKIAALFAAVLLLVLSQAAFAADATGSFSRNLTVSGNPQVEISTGSGNINVRTGDGNRIKIEGRIKASDNWGWTGGSRLSAEERVRRLEANPPIEQSGNVVTIGHIDDSDLRNVSISYDVTLPAGTKLESHTGSGSQSIQDLRGPLQVTTGSGSIEVGRMGSSVNAESGSGQITIGGAEGDVNARTGSGHMILHNIKAGLRASTGSGGIEADGDARNDWDLHTGSGGIEVRTPASAGFRVDAESGSGGVTVNKPVTMQGSIRRNRIEGTVGSGGPLMRLRTGSGGIHVD